MFLGSKPSGRATLSCIPANYLHFLPLQITTFSRLLTSHDCELLESEVMDRALKLTILSLQQFDTEYSFLREVR